MKRKQKIIAIVFLWVSLVAVSLWWIFRPHSEVVPEPTVEVVPSCCTNNGDDSLNDTGEGDAFYKEGKKDVTQTNVTTHTEVNTTPTPTQTPPSNPAPTPTYIVPPTQIYYIEVPVENETTPPTEEEVKALELKQEINSLLQTVETQIASTRAKIASASGSSSSSGGCVKTSNGCTSAGSNPSYNVSAQGVILVQLTARRDRLADILAKLEKNGINAITAEDMQFLSTLN